MPLLLLAVPHHDHVLLFILRFIFLLVTSERRPLVEPSVLSETFRRLAYVLTDRVLVLLLLWILEMVIYMALMLRLLVVLIMQMLFFVNPAAECLLEHLLMDYLLLTLIH